MNALTSSRQRVKILAYGPNASSEQVNRATEILSSYRVDEQYPAVAPLFVINTKLKPLGLFLKMEGRLNNNRAAIKYQFNWISSASDFIPKNVPVPVMLVKTGGRIGYVMERIDGQELEYNYRKLCGQLNGKPEIITAPLIEAKRKLHEKGMVHGDMMDGRNIMIEEGTFRVVLIDPSHANDPHMDFKFRDNCSVEFMCRLLRRTPEEWTRIYGTP